jgi:hypothetical protein
MYILQDFRYHLQISPHHLHHSHSFPKDLTKKKEMFLQSKPHHLHHLQSYYHFYLLIHLHPIVALLAIDTFDRLVE